MLWSCERMLQSVCRWLFPSRIIAMLDLFLFLRFFFFCFHRHQQKQLPPEVGQLWGSWEPHRPWDTRAEPQAPGGAEGEALQSYSALRWPCVESSRWGLESASVPRYKQTGCMFMVQPALNPSYEAMFREHPGFASLFDVHHHQIFTHWSEFWQPWSLFHQQIICI